MFVLPKLTAAHQIRVHLQYLGFPIANDPLYSHESIWGEKLGQGGVDLVPSDSSKSAADTLDARKKEPKPPLWWKNKEKKAAARKGKKADAEDAPVEEIEEKVEKVDLNDREYANIDAGSPIRLSQQARDIIAKLRRARDEQEDWVK